MEPAQTETKSELDVQNPFPLAVRRTHRQNAGAKRKAAMQAEKEGPSTTPKDKSKDDKKKKKKKMMMKRKSAPAAVPANFAQSSANWNLKQAVVRGAKIKKPVSNILKKMHPQHDFYCWKCHTQEAAQCFVFCGVCPRVYHVSCADLKAKVHEWVCPECVKITDAECTDTQSSAMANMSLGKIAKVLRCALDKSRSLSAASLFSKPISTVEFIDYSHYVFYPMDLFKIENMIQRMQFGSTEAFLAELRWIVHNSLVYFGSGNKYSSGAKSILKTCEVELGLIEACPDCYLTSISKRPGWFAEVCAVPHKLIWGKLQGFPFWPAKVLKEQDGLVEAHFFGQHDRAMLPAHNCFLYSEKIPFPASKKRLTGLNNAIKEVEVHIAKLKEVRGYEYAPHLTPYDPNRRYTTGSLAVMPDGKLKSMTEVNRNAKLKALARENGTDLAGNAKAEVDIVKNQPANSPGTAEIDVGGPPGQDVDGKPNVIVPDEERTESVVPDREETEATVEGSTEVTSEDPSKVAKSETNDGSMEVQTSSCADEQPSEDSTEVARAEIVGICEDTEDVGISEGRADGPGNTGLKRKLSSPESDVPEKSARTESPRDFAMVKDGDDVSNSSNRAAEQEGSRRSSIDSSELNADEQAADLDDSLRDISEDVSNSSALPSKVSEKDMASQAAPSSGAKEGDFSILPSRLPNLDDLEASVTSSEACSTPPPADSGEVKDAQSGTIKDSFVENLSKTIDNCKASLGLDEESGDDGDEMEEDEEEEEEDVASTGEETFESEVELDGVREEKEASKQLGIADDQSDAGDAVEEEAIEESAKDAAIDSGDDTDGKNREVAIENDQMDVDEQDSCDQDTKEKESPEISSVTKPEDEVSTQSSEEIESQLSDGQDKDKTTSAPSNLKSVPEADTCAPIEIEDDDDDDDDNKDKTTSAPSNLKSVLEADTSAPIEIEDDDDDDDDDNDAGMYGIDSSSDGELQIDEGSAKEEIKSTNNIAGAKGEGKVSSGTGAAAETSPTDVPGEGAPANLDIEKKSPQPSRSEQEKAADESERTEQGGSVSGVDSTSPGEPTDKKDVDEDGGKSKDTDVSSQDPADPVSGIPKPPKKDPDYEKLIAKVVEDAVKSFKEVEEKVGEASPELKSLVLNLQREVIALRAKQELQQKELLHCNKLAAAEVAQVMEYSREAKLSQMRKRYDRKSEVAIKDTKKKQWCANCLAPSNYFCCWNTSYCKYSCQEDHWNKHERHCQQKSGNFPFIPGPDFDPFRKKKKKKKKNKNREKQLLSYDGDVGDESSGDDPSWAPDPEDLPTMVPRKRIPGGPDFQASNISTAKLPPPNVVHKVWDKVSQSWIGTRQANVSPHRTWTSLGGQVQHPGVALQGAMVQRTNVQGAAVRVQAAMPAGVVNPGIVTQSRPVILSNAPRGAPVKPVRLVGNNPNVVYMAMPGVQISNPAVSQNAVRNPAPMRSPVPMRFSLGAQGGQMGMQSLVQALQQQKPLQPGSKYVVALTPGSNVPHIRVVSTNNPVVQTNSAMVLANGGAGGGIAPPVMAPPVLNTAGNSGAPQIKIVPATNNIAPPTSIGNGAWQVVPKMAHEVEVNSVGPMFTTGATKVAGQFY